MPGVAATVRRVEPPAGSDDGEAEPTPVGGVGGRTEQSWIGDAVLRGAGATAVKSEPLSSVSVQPEAARRTAVVFTVAGAADEPSKKLAPSQPTRSTIVASAVAEHGVELPLQPSGVVVFTSATLPPVPLMLIGVESVTSGVGSGSAVPVPAASCTSR